MCKTKVYTLWKSLHFEKSHFQMDNKSIWHTAANIFFSINRIYCKMDVNMAFKEWGLEMQKFCSLFYMVDFCDKCYIAIITYIDNNIYTHVNE